MLRAPGVVAVEVKGAREVGGQGCDLQLTGRSISLPRLAFGRAAVLAHKHFHLHIHLRRRARQPPALRRLSGLVSTTKAAGFTQTLLRPRQLAGLRHVSGREPAVRLQNPLGPK